MTTTAKRGTQAKPTHAEVVAAWGRLRAAASQGSVEASALLIALAERRPILQTSQALTA
jgi:hypothetical protein